MFGFKERRAVRNARRVYELARIESLIAENRRQIEARREAAECRFCKEAEATATV